MSSGFQIDPLWGLGALFLGVVLLGVWFFWLRKKKRAHLGYSHLEALKVDRIGWRVRLARLPTYLKIGALCCFLASLADPSLVVEAKPKLTPWPDEEMEEEELEETIKTPTEGVALYFVLDRSGSMGQEVTLVEGKSRRRLSRLEVLKRLTTQFIRGNQGAGLQGRQDDMIGLISFARVAQVMAPLTLDHRAVVDELGKLGVARFRQEDGTAIGYALFKTTNMIAATKYFSQELISEGKPSYDINSTVIVLVTDGLQNPNPLDADHALRTMSLTEASTYAAGQGVRVYIVNVEPMIKYPQYASHRLELEKAAENTGGKFYIAEGPHSLLEIYQEIDTLERSALPQEQIIDAKIKQKKMRKELPANYERHSLIPLFVGSGMFLFLAGVALSATWLRRGL